MFRKTLPVFFTTLSKKKASHYGFTLAEVLITLTIVGVIAALTIPNLMHKWHQKEMEVSFKRAQYRINQAILNMKKDSGENVYFQYVIPYKDERGWQHHYYLDFATPFYKYFQLYNDTKMHQRVAQQESIKTYNKNTYINASGKGSNTKYLANDATSVVAFINWATIFIYIDTNGAFKGPNAMGHDVFVFQLDENDKVTSLPNKYLGNNYAICSKTNTTDMNGFGCTYYAMINKCPDDESKTYWECLP